MAVLRCVGCVLLVLATASCERAPERLTYAEPGWSVHAVVVAGEGDVEVAVARFDAAGHALPVTDATVTLRGPDGGTSAPAAPCGAGSGSGGEATAPGCYRLRLPRAPASGDPWQLFVLLPDGRLAHGTTVVPPVPHLRSPGESSRIEVRNRGVPIDSGFHQVALALIPVEATPYSPSAEFDVVIRPGGVMSGGAEVPGAACDFARRFSSTAVGSATDGVFLTGLTSVRCSVDGAPVAWDSVAADVSVVAYDTAYSRYLRQVVHGTAVRREYASAGLSGAYGVFGAGASASRQVMLISTP